jgi:hypothetical protein
MLSDTILIILVVFVSISILYKLASYVYGTYLINTKVILDIIILVGILYLLFLQNNQIHKLVNNPQDSTLVENMNAYLITLSPLVPMVDKDGNPITYPPS